MFSRMGASLDQPAPITSASRPTAPCAGRPTIRPVRPCAAALKEPPARRLPRLLVDVEDGSGFLAARHSWTPRNAPRGVVWQTVVPVGRWKPSTPPGRSSSKVDLPVVRLSIRAYETGAGGHGADPRGWVKLLRRDRRVWLGGGASAPHRAGPGSSPDVMAPPQKRHLQERRDQRYLAPGYHERAGP